MKSFIDVFVLLKPALGGLYLIVLADLVDRVPLSPPETPRIRLYLTLTSPVDP
jgi:hypothetical protein